MALDTLPGELEQSFDQVSPTEDLALALKVLADKQGPYAKYWQYYDGDQPTKFSVERLAEVFEKLHDVRFTENWCAVVVDAAADRLDLSGFAAADAVTQQRLSDLWAEYDLALEASDVHESALVTGEAFVIVWPNPTSNPDQPELDVYFNPPELIAMFYEEDRPKVKKFAAKWWQDIDGTHVTLYYPDRLEYWIAPGSKTRIPTNTDKVDSADLWVTELGRYRKQQEDAENPHGVVPIAHFRTERRGIVSSLNSVIPIQDSINKFFADMMVVSDFSTFRQRWVVSNADLSTLMANPYSLWQLPKGDGGMDGGEDTKVGEFELVPLKQFTDVMDRQAATIAIMSRTPKHYLYNQGGDPSGEALIAAEAPLNARVRDYIKHFVPAWRDVVRLMLSMLGEAAPDTTSITVQYRPPETVLPLTQAHARKTNVDAGMPLVAVLREEGKSPAEIDQILADLNDKAARDQASLEASIAARLRNFDQNNQNIGN